MQKPIYITGLSSISPLGKSTAEIWKSYQNNAHYITNKNGVFIAELPQDAKAEIEHLKVSEAKYKTLDDSVLFAIYAARNAVKQAAWDASDNFGINIGSSRGATQLFEKYHSYFLNQKRAKALSSPTTTLGNISSWLAQDLRTQGPEISHSITCSTALHALLNGMAWIHSGLCDKFLVGGSEAPLTPFTIAQMQALKIYSKVKTGQESPSSQTKFPCRALDSNKSQNTMVLGEAASVICMEKKASKKALAKVIGFGYATEILEHNVSLSTNADCFQRSMTMAIGNTKLDEIDIIITHTPGTIKGDVSELNAITAIFGKTIPALTTNKWKLGHTLGASGMLSVEMAVLMLQQQQFIAVPYIEGKRPKKIKNILVNAVGFGGNAVSILVQKANC